MIENLMEKTANELRDLAVSDFPALVDSLKELKGYQLTQVGKTLAIPRYTVMSKDELYRAVVAELSTEESEFASAISVDEIQEEVKDITFQLLTNTSLEEHTYPANTTMSSILEKLGMQNKSVAIKGELIPRSRLNHTLEQLGAENSIIAVITKTANA